MSFQRLPLKALLGLGFGLMLLLMTLLVAANGLGLMRLHDGIHAVGRQRVPNLVAINRWQISVLQSARHMRNVFILDGQPAVDREIASIEERRQERHDLQETLGTSMSLPAEKEALERVVDIRKQYRVSEEEFMKLARAGDLVAAKKVLLETTRPLQLQYQIGRAHV